MSHSSKIGLMGCGKVADYGHLPAITSTSGLELHAVFDPDPTRLAKVAEKYGIDNTFSDVDAFFKSDLDAVAITSPAPCHLENVLQAAKYRKHILCEKPLGMNVQECEEMDAAAAEAGVMLFTAFDYRFSPVSLQIRQWVEEQAIGDVLSLRLVYIWHCHGKYSTSPDGNREINARREGRMLEGGPLVDCGVHQIDLARFWLQSEAVRWSGHGAWVDSYVAPDHVYLHMDHACGAHTMVEMSFSYCHTSVDPINQFTYELIGTDGLIRYDRNAKLFELRSKDHTESFPFASEKNFASMYEAFSTALQAGKSDVLPTGFDGLMAAKISREVTDSIIMNRLDPQSD